MANWSGQSFGSLQRTLDSIFIGPSIIQLTQTIHERSVVRSRKPFKFWVTNHISGTAEARVVKFCTKVGYVKSRYGRQITLKKAWSQSCDPLQNVKAPSNISGTAEARIIKFCIQVNYQILIYGCKPPLTGAWSGTHDLFSVSMPPIISLERLRQESPNFVSR